jgi:hypothetical protein
LEREAKAGASFRLRASDYGKYDFQRIARGCAQGGGQLTIYDSETLSEWDRKDIRKGAEGHVTFEF